MISAPLTSLFSWCLIVLEPLRDKTADLKRLEIKRCACTCILLKIKTARPSKSEKKDTNQLILLFGLINIAKTESMLVGTTPRPSGADSFSISVNSKAIKRVYQFTYLGLVFDDRRSWNNYIEHFKQTFYLGRLRSAACNFRELPDKIDISDFSISVWRNPLVNY